MRSVIKNTLISEEEIQIKIEELGKQISEQYHGQELVMISILNGAMVFTADLIRKIDADVILDTMIVSSYGSGSRSSGVIKVLQDCRYNIEGKHVLIVDDIIDTGNTLFHLCELLRTRKPKSLKTCVFLDKPSRRIAKIEPDFYACQIPDAFAVGYGLDYDGHYRHLPYIAVVELIED